MGLFDTILGRSKPVRANLDALFALPSAAVTLQTSAGLVSSGAAGVCWTVLASVPTPDWAGTTITFDIAPAGDGGTVLRFTHHGLTPQLECYSMCDVGWTQSLASLVDYVDRDGGNASG